MNTILNSKILLSLLGIITAGMILSTINLRSQRNIVARDVRDVESKIREVKKDNEYLNKFLNHFQNSAFLQKEARLKLNYKAPGEEVVFVYRDLNEKASKSLSEEEVLKSMPNYRKWIRYIFDH